MNESEHQTIPETEASAGVEVGMSQEALVGTLMNMAESGDFGDRLAFAAAQSRRTFGGRRDVMQVLGYAERPSYGELWTRYQRQDIAGRVIDLPVDQTWGGGVMDIEGFPDWERFNKRLEVQSRLTELDRLSSIGEFAVILIGVKEQAGAGSETVGEQAQDKVLEKPIDKLSSLEDVLYLQQYPRNAVNIKKTVSNPSDPRFGKPETYEIEVASDVSVTGSTGSSSVNISGSTTKLLVHHSRILHVTPTRILSDVTGFSRLLRILDRLHDLDKVVGGSAEMFWQGADRAMVITRNSSPGGAGGASVGSGDGRTALRGQAEEWAHGLRRLLFLTNSEAKTLDAITPDPSGIVASLLQLIAAGSGIPLRMLVGSERGELASTQDRSNFADTIANRRSNFAEPQIVVPLLRKLNGWGVAPDPLTLTTVWPPIETLGAQERSDVEKNRITAMKTGEEMIALGGGSVFTAEEIRGALGFEGPAPDAAISGAGVDIDVDESNPEVSAQFQRSQAA